MRRSQTPYVILGILAFESNQSGYQIRRTVKDSVGFFWGESYGQIYPTLKRLAAQGLITEQPSGSSAKRRRRAYSLTPAGHDRLREWLAQPYRYDPPRDEFLLKLFFAYDAAPGVAITHVLKFQEEHRQILALFLHIEKLARLHNSAQPGFPYWMLTLSYGLARIQSELAWSETALETLRALESVAVSSQPTTHHP